MIGSQRRETACHQYKYLHLTPAYAHIACTLYHYVSTCGFYRRIILIIGKNGEHCGRRFAIDLQKLVFCVSRLHKESLEHRICAPEGRQWRGDTDHRSWQWHREIDGTQVC